MNSLLDEARMMWLGAYIETGATQCPERAAIITAESSQTLSYRELDRRIARAIHELRARGVKPGDRLAYLGRNDGFFYVLVFAAARGGFLLAPLNWRCQAPEIAYFLSDSTPRLMFADADFMPVAQAAMEQSGQTPILLATAPGQGERSDFAEAVAAEGPEDRYAIDKGDTGFLLLYTSGTSGPPKGVVTTHRALSLMRHMELVHDDFPRWSGETIVSGMPGFHIAGISWMLIGLMRQSTCVLTANPSAPNLTRLIREHHASRTFAVPTVIRDIVDEVRRSGDPLPSLKMFLYGAMPIGETLLRDAIETLGCSFGQYYGMTEIAGSATFLAPGHHDLERPELMQSVGKPFPATELEIRDAVGRPVHVDEPGEIYIRTPSLMGGYWRREEATAAAVDAGGWYRTGDGGRLDAQGFLYLTDRVKDMIITGGENVYPNEVEEALIQHPAVLASAVVGRPHPRWGESIVAVVETKPDHTVSEDELISFARARIAAYKCPKAVCFLSPLPRTASGKVQRQEARRRMLERLEPVASES